MGQLTSSNGKSVVSIGEIDLETVRMLAREGNREIVIRRTIGLTPSQWKRARDAEDSPLAEALEYGRAEGLGEVVAFMKERMTEGKSERAAEWLANRLYGEKDQDTDKAPRIVINLGTAPAPDIETFRATRVIEHDN